jgi:4-hydroxybenzoate polyprenyltransferase
MAGLVGTGVLLYDGVFKNSWHGPVWMGLCRGANLLLGASMAGASLLSDLATGAGTRWYIVVAAAAHALYVTGLTISARREAVTSLRSQLMLGWSVAAVGLGTMAGLPWIVPRATVQHLREPWWFVILWACMAAPVVRRSVVSVRHPDPPHVQAAVKQAILNLILFDAVLVLQFAGPVPGALVCVMILPTLWLGRYFAST